MFKIYHVAKGKDQKTAHEQGLPVLNTFADGYQSVVNNYKKFASDMKRCGAFLDSGAFTFGKKGHSEQEHEIVLNSYLDFLNSDYNVYEINAQLDTLVVGTRANVDSVYDGAEKTFENYQYMLDRVKHPERLCIVYHIQKERLDVLKRLLHYSSNGKRAGCIAISQAYRDSIENKIRTLEPAFEMIMDSPFADLKKHCLGMTIPQVLQKYPFTSSDSTSVQLAAGFGMVFYWLPEKNYYTRLFVGRLSHGVKKKGHKQMPKKQFDEFKAYVKDFGFTLDDIEGDDCRDGRVKFNFAVMKRYADNHKCEYKHITIKKLF